MMARNQGAGGAENVARFHAQQAQQHADHAQHAAQWAQYHAGGTRLSDEDMQKGIQGLMDSVPLTKRAHLEAHVQDGVATLHGTTHDKEVKKTAAHIAWRYPDVRDVRNDIQVQR